MADQETIENETPTPEEGSPVAQQKVQLAQSNGVTQPREGTKTRRVWELADEISQATGRPALRGEVMEAGKADGLSAGTVATQYGKWCTFHGVTGDQLKQVREQVKAATEANKAADETPEGDAQPETTEE